jgi:hypothetical protein
LPKAKMYKGAVMLVVDREQEKLTDKEVRERIELLLPEIVSACAVYKSGKVKAVMLHQDAFASDYENPEMWLLGLAIKYCGLQGIPVYIVGTNGETLK